MRGLLSPGAGKILLFAAFLLIAVAGHIQSEGFGDDAGQQNFLPALPFWEVWMLLLAPYAVIAAIFRFLGIDIAAFRGTMIIFWGVQLVYFYILACVLVGVIAGFRHKRKTVK